MGKHVKQDAEKLGEDISFGLQQTLACWATDFIDPYVSNWFQAKYKVEGKHEGNLKHTWAGEIVGDSAAFFVFLGVQRYLPEPMHWFTRSVKKCLNPFYEWTGKKSLKSWADHHGLSEDSETYKHKLEEWKEFQADNFARSSVISVSSVAANVATQKAMGNTHKLSVITGSKLIGAAITMATMLGLRMAIPKTTKELDEELSARYFTPLIRKTQKMMGAKVEEPARHTHKDGEHHPHHHDEKSEYTHSLHVNDYPAVMVNSEELPVPDEILKYSQKIREEKKSPDPMMGKK